MLYQLSYVRARLPQDSEPGRGIPLAARRRHDGCMAKLALTSDERGQTMAEYSVVLAVISAGIVLALTQLSGKVAQLVEQVAGYMD
jgi:Flp pilus assembly pilin Flp